jgi:nucleoside-diphosphate-sugar epimerase
MSLHTIVGAGAVGSGTALRLADSGHDVRVVTRSGTGPAHPNIELVAADATDATRLTELARAAHAVYNCANPPYDKWATAWPPLGDAFLAAAEATGARLVTMSNLYGFAPGTSPMTATGPLDPSTRKGRIRTDMWHAALAAHDEGRIRATEARASDYFGPGLGETSHLGDRGVARALAGKRVSTIGAVDVIHSWTYIDDVCATLATLGTDDRSLGRAWHVPTLPPRSARDMVAEICATAGVDPVKVARIPTVALRLGGVFVPMIRELLEMRYQFDEPFEIDSTGTTETFGLTATPIAEQMRATVAFYREASTIEAA